jgi:hypothetical protein
MPSWNFIDTHPLWTQQDAVAEVLIGLPTIPDRLSAPDENSPCTCVCVQGEDSFGNVLETSA